VTGHQNRDVSLDAAKLPCQGGVWGQRGGGGAQRSICSRSGYMYGFIHFASRWWWRRQQQQQHPMVQSTSIQQHDISTGIMMHSVLSAVTILPCLAYHILHPSATNTTTFSLTSRRALEIRLLVYTYFELLSLSPHASDRTVAQRDLHERYGRSGCRLRAHHGLTITRPVALLAALVSLKWIVIVHRRPRGRRIDERRRSERDMLFVLEKKKGPPL